MIQHIKKNNKDPKRLQKIDIKWIKWHNKWKIKPELVSIVIKFLTSIYANITLDYNIFLGQQIFDKIAFNKAGKSIW